MHSTIIELKNGKRVCGPLWTFRPKEGWLELAAMDDEDLASIGNTEHPGRIYLRDIVSAVTKGERISIGVIGDCDELARAREQGWDGT
jgi:hypothetical protein